MLFVQVDDGNPNGYTLIPMHQVEKVVLDGDRDFVIANGKKYDVLNSGNFYDSLEDIEVPESRKTWIEAKI